MKTIFTRLLTLIVLIVLMNGCQKEENLMSLQGSVADSAPFYIVKKLHELPQLENFLRSGMRFQGGRSTYFNIDDIDTSLVYMHEWGNIISYNLLLPTKNNENYNLIVEEVHGSIVNAKVFGKKLVSSTTIQYSQYSLEEVFGSGGRNDRLQECLRLFFQWKPIKGFWYDPDRTSFPWNPLYPYGSDESVVSTGTIGYGGPIGFPFPTSVSNPSEGSGTGSSGSSGGNQGGDGNNGDCNCGDNQVKRVVWDDKTQTYSCYCETIRAIVSMGTGTRNFDRSCKDLLLRMSIIDRGDLLIPDRIDEKLQECQAANPELSARIHELASGAISNPCRSDNTFGFNPYEMEAMLCLSGNYNDEGLEKALNDMLEGDDYIIIPGNFKEKCPKAACMMDKMLNIPSSSFFCSLTPMFEGFDGSNKGLGYHLRFVTDLGGKDAPSGWKALASVQKETGRVFISFNSTNCENSDFIDIFETLQHEMIHAYLYQSLLNTGWNGNLNTYADAFHAYVQHTYGKNATSTQHQIMLDYFVDQMVQSLIEANGGIGTYQDFEGLVLNGFGNDVLDYCVYSIDDIQTKLDRYNNFISNPNNISSLFNSCP